MEISPKNYFIMKKLLWMCIVCLPLCATAQKNKTENVFIITLDGFRWQELYAGADSALIAEKKYTKHPDEARQLFWATSGEERRKKLLPFLWSTLAAQGQLYGNRAYGNFVNCSNQMWFSYPGYNEILTGSADDDHINSNDKKDNPNTTVLEYLNGLPAYKGKVAAFGSWDVFPFIINEKRSGIPVNAGFESAEGKKLSEREIFLNELQKEIPSPFGSVRLDAFTHHYALEYLKRNSPRVMYISYGETDDFAHEGNYDAYLRSAYQTDQFIQSLWNWVQSQPGYKDKTTFLITTDHGRGTVPLDTWRSHGNEIKGADEIWFAVIGPDTRALGEVKQAMQLYQKQVAPTAAGFLGIEFKPKSNSGDVVKAMVGKDGAAR